MRTDFGQAIDELRARIYPLARFVHGFAGTLDQPIKDQAEAGYRFVNHGARHFCLLRACRVVSALNAMIALAEGGFTQEIGILFRVVYEAYTQIEAAIAQIRNDGDVSGDVATFIADYFGDSQRRNVNRAGRSDGKAKRSNLSQKVVNELIGAQLEPFSMTPRDDPTWTSAAEKLANLNRIFSNYVHGRYPETMDLYGGIPGRFHLAGMRGTPKDWENLETIGTIITSASRCFVSVVQTLDLRDVLTHDPMLTEWYRRLGDYDQ